MNSLMNVSRYVSGGFTTVPTLTAGVDKFITMKLHKEAI